MMNPGAYAFTVILCGASSRAAKREPKDEGTSTSFFHAYPLFVLSPEQRTLWRCTRPDWLYLDKEKEMFKSNTNPFGLISPILPA